MKTLTKLTKKEKSVLEKYSGYKDLAKELFVNKGSYSSELLEQVTFNLILIDILTSIKTKVT